MSKLIVALGDMHCGHEVGLLTPGWFRDSKDFPHLNAIEDEMYCRYKAFTKKYHKPDVLFVNGDSIEGKGEKSGGCELVTSDRNEQVNIAVKLIQMWNAKRVILTYGTGYHVGNEEDFEKNVAKELGCEIHSHFQAELDGVIFDVKHHCGGSGMPHTKGTPLTKEMLFNLLWKEAGQCEKADIILRSHVHNYFHTDSIGWDAFTLPALQAPGSKYGSRRCSGMVHWGIIPFEINRGGFRWTKENIVQLESAKSELIRL